MIYAFGRNTIGSMAFFLSAGIIEKITINKPNAILEKKYDLGSKTSRKSRLETRCLPKIAFLSNIPLKK